MSATNSPHYTVEHPIRKGDTVNIHISLSAALYVLLGMLLKSKTFFMHDAAPMLNLFYGIELSDSYVNFLLTKCAAWLFIAGFMRVFPGRIGAHAGALLIAFHPLFSMNSSRLGLFTAVIALFWWLLTVVQEKENLYIFLPAVWIFLCAAILSPWLILLFPFCILKILPFESPKNILSTFYEQKRPLSKKCRTFSILIFCFSIIVFFLVCPSHLQKQILQSSCPNFLKTFVLSVHTWQFIYDWKSMLLFGACLGAATWLHSLFFLAFFLCAVLSLTHPLDLGGILCLWISLSAIAAILINRISENFILFQAEWKKASFLLVFFAFCLCLFKKQAFDQILNARQFYASGFYHHCGDHEENNKLLSQTLWGVSKGNFQSECWLAFGNYHTPLPGRYQTTFYLISSNAAGSYVEIAQDNGKHILARQTINKGNDSDVLSFSSITVDYDTTAEPISPLEQRVYYGGEGTLYFKGTETHRSL